MCNQVVIARLHVQVALKHLMECLVFLSDRPNALNGPNIPPSNSDVKLAHSEMTRAMERINEASKELCK